MATRFVARVELHDAGPEEYGILHDEMEARGYTKIISAGGVIYNLPTGTYITGTVGSKDEALAAARGAANATGNTSSIVIVQTEETLVHRGLEKDET